MKFSEWADGGGQFILSGGPSDGHKVSAIGWDMWPSELVYRGSVYRMRIGDLDHYDYVGPAASERGE